jgi:hypothetical protein
MKTSRLVLAAVAAAAGLALVGCNKEQKTSDNMNKTSSATTTPASMHAVNKTCPISGEPVPANATTVSYQGKTVGLCCDHCVDKWNKMSESEKSAKLAASSK